MLPLLAGFITIALGVFLATQIVTFGETLYNKLNSSDIQEIRNLAPLSVLIILVFVVAVVAAGAALIWVGFKGLANKA